MTCSSFWLSRRSSALDLLLPLPDLLLELGPGAVDDLLGLDGGVLQAGLRGSLGLLDDAAAVLRNVSQPTGRELAAG